MSDGGRDRALLPPRRVNCAEAWKSSQKWSVERSASLLAKAFGVRSVPWLGRWREKHRLENQ
jgi:hypothetical protein